MISGRPFLSRPLCFTAEEGVPRRGFQKSLWKVKLPLRAPCSACLGFFSSRCLQIKAFILSGGSWVLRPEEAASGVLRMPRHHVRRLNLSSTELESGNAIDAFLQIPAPVLDKIPGPMGARFLSSTGLGSGNLIERAQFPPAPALDKNRSPTCPPPLSLLFPQGHARGKGMWGMDCLKALVLHCVFKIHAYVEGLKSSLRVARVRLAANWTKMDLFRPKWTSLVHFGSVNATFRFGKMSF